MMIQEGRTKLSVSKNHDLTFSNPLFDIDEDFTSSDESFSEEDVPNENFKIFSNPLFDLDEEITSTKIPKPFDVVEDIPYVPNIFATTIPPLQLDFDFISSNDLGSVLDVSSPFEKIYNKIYDPGICIEVESTRILTPLPPVIDTFT
ncbi:hypothetical protein Tco_0875945 [Tanacetum coccineum]|uniref:Reverse transcriptase domain-containing protein n=1 Tax=Tanacetum coccineum TaxID=301880 RepID=A0ABQ5BSJ4_9ASTR